MARETPRDGATSVRPVSFRIVPALALVIAVACAGGDQGGADTAQMGGAAGTPGAPAGGDTAGGAAAGGQQGGTMSEADITPQMIATGEQIFTGKQGGGICYTCHGPDASGLPQLGPNLTDQEWLNGDGSLGFIMNTIRTGVLQPKQFPAPMPPFGAQFSDEQVRALAAYVYSRSHPEVGKGG